MKHNSGYEFHREPRPLDLTLAISPRPHSHSFANRRVVNSKIQRLYPILLLASTAVAGVFCFAYITKPVTATYSSIPEKVAIINPITPPPVIPVVKTESPSNILPGLKPKNQPSVTKQAPPSAPHTVGFEETNIRMQHILDAECSNGEIHRIVIDVPALYKSRNLRWSQNDAAHARVLLRRLEDYQEKSQTLREEGSLILADWNKLMDTSTPNQILRADSPSVSSNLLKSSRINHSPNSDAVKIQRDKESP